MSFPLYTAIVIQILLVVILYNFLPISSAKQFNEAPLISTSFGQVKGKLDLSQNGKVYAQYLGLPYAHPPIGDRRFKRPDPYDVTWSQVRDGTKAPPLCIQKSKKEPGNMVGKEDCLVLNVYKPASCTSISKCAVMVWIHPGGYSSMDGSPDTFGPQMWMDHEVILVSINYRLGVLGFLTLENDDAPGNLGLRDQALALRWIKKEIVAFGGDSDRITLFGSGAGGQSVLFQMMAPQNIGQALFQRVISQSGSPVEDKHLDFPRSRRSYALELASSLGCKAKAEDLSKTLKCLQKLDPGLLQSKLTMFAENEMFTVPNPFVPTVAGKQVSDPFIPQKPEQILELGKFEKVPVILGGNAHEGIVIMSQFLAHPGYYANFTESLPLLLFNKPDSFVTERDNTLVETVKKAYLESKRIHRNNMKQGIQMFTDFSFLGKIGRTVQLLQSHEDMPPVYQYLYRYSGTHTFGDLSVYAPWKLKFKLFLQSFGIGYNMRNGYGICHGDELMLMFKMGHLDPPMGQGPASDRDKLISWSLLRMWTNFAKTGEPTKANGTFQWVPTKEPDMKYAALGADFLMNQDPHFWERVRFFDVIASHLGKSLDTLDLSWLQQANKSNDKNGSEKDQIREKVDL